MKLYALGNKNLNFLSGLFYFAGNSKEAVVKLAKQFQKEHNKGQLASYTLDFDFGEVLECELKEGFIPINRDLLNYNTNKVSLIN